MSQKRLCEHWLKSLLQYVEDTEAPRHFWFWGGISTITSAMQRKVWVPFGLDPLFPNLYIVLVAAPGRCRKGGPVGLARKMLHEINIPVSVDSMSKRALTKELVQLGKSQYFQFKDEGGETRSFPQAAIGIYSKEMSSLLTLDPKGMIECLTDLYDSADKWAYKTSDKGEDFLYGVCINLFAATTPTWIAANLPEEAIGGGFTSRVALIYGDKKYKRVTLPDPPNTQLYGLLIRDLARISNLIGPFKWTPEAFEIFDLWYQELGKVREKTPNEKLHAFIERMHIMCLKVAMALHVCYSDELIFMPNDIGQAIDVLKITLKSADKVFAGHGRNELALDQARIKEQIKQTKQVTFIKLLEWNMSHVSRSQLAEVIDNLVDTGYVTRVYQKQGGELLTWREGR